MPNASSNEAHTSQPGRELSVVLTTMLRRPGNAPWGSDSKVCLPMIMACPQVVSLKWARSSGRCQGSVPSMPIARLRAMATMMLTMGYESFLFSILADRCCWPVGQCFHEAQRLLAVSDKGKAARRARGQCHGLFPKVIDRLGRVKFGLWECRLVESRAERERRVGNYVLAFFTPSSTPAWMT